MYSRSESGAGIARNLASQSRWALDDAAVKPRRSAEEGAVASRSRPRATAAGGRTVERIAGSRFGWPDGLPASAGLFKGWGRGAEGGDSSWPRWTRTTIPRSKVWCPAVGRGASARSRLQLRYIAGVEQRVAHGPRTTPWVCPCCVSTSYARFFARPASTTRVAVRAKNRAYDV